MPLLGHTRVWVRESNAILEPLRDASCCRTPAWTEYGRDLAPAIQAPQANLPAGHEAEEQHERRVDVARGLAIRCDWGPPSIADA